jgi:hypothetical protein
VDSRHLGQFAEWFNSLAVIHRLACSEDLKAKMLAEYFAVLEPYPIEAIESAYQSLRRKMKKWPVPADWLENLPPYGSTARLPLASPAEVAESDEAERLGYEAAAVCTCSRCVQAECFMPPRYVPRLDDQGQLIERRHPSRTGRALLLGRWLHGEELKRWYRARADFYALKAKLAEKLPLPTSPDERLAQLRKTARGVIAETTAAGK